MGKKLWMKLNPESRLPDYIYVDWPKLDAQVLSTPDISYTYVKKANIFQIKHEPILHFDLQLEKIMEDLVERLAETEDVGNKIQIQREYDPNFAKEMVVIFTEDKNNALKITIDPDTKLPINLHVIRTANFGTFVKDFDQIIFDEEFPEGLFSFTIPEGAVVINQDEGEGLENDPNLGIALDGLTKQEAAELLAEKYWHSVINSDFEELKKIRPAYNLEKAKKVLEIYFSLKDNPPVELVEIGELGKEYGCAVGDILPCIVRHQDGTFKEYKPIIKFREIDGKASCIITGHYGMPQKVE